MGRSTHGHRGAGSSPRGRDPPERLLPRGGVFDAPDASPQGSPGAAAADGGTQEATEETARVFKVVSARISPFSSRGHWEPTASLPVAAFEPIRNAFLDAGSNYETLDEQEPEDKTDGSPPGPGGQPGRGPGAWFRQGAGNPPAKRISGSPRVLLAKVVLGSPVGVPPR